MRAIPALLAFAVLLLAGCSGEAPDGDGAPADDQGPRATQGTADNATRIWQHEEDLDLNSAIPPTTMQVPANATGLVARLRLSTTAPCGVGLPEPGATEAWVEFTSPSGAATRLDATGYVCRVGPLSAQGGAPTDQASLEAEAGEWQVTFGGRGLSARLHATVDGVLAEA